MNQVVSKIRENLREKPFRILESFFHYVTILALFYAMKKMLELFQPIEAMAPPDMFIFLMLALIWEIHRYRIQKLENRVGDLDEG